MTPQENHMLATMLDRLKQAPTQPKDADAEAMIRQAVMARSDLPYLLAQTVLIQDLALKQAQDRIEAAERRRANEDSFLARLFGNDADRSGQSSLAAPSPMPLRGSQRVPQGSSFLRDAAATAAGVAGGALLFQGIQSMFGHEATAALSGQPGLSEATQAEAATEPPQEPDQLAGIDNADFADDELI